MLVQTFVVIRLAYAGPISQPRPQRTSRSSREHNTMHDRGSTDLQHEPIGFFAETLPPERETLFPKQYSLDLLQVVEVVPGKHTDHVLNGFLATLGMHSGVLPLFGLQ
jgi:hypothetical protein